MTKTLQTWLFKISNQRYFRQVLIAAAVGILLVTLTPMENLSYDVACQAKPDTTITNAVLVYINEGTLVDLPNDHGSLNRTIHAQLLDRLRQDGARLVFYDVAFDQTNQAPENDQALVRSVRNQGSVILVGTCEDSIEQGVGRVITLFPPMKPLLEAAKGWGHAELFGNVVRQISGDYQFTQYAVWVAATNLEPQEFRDENPNRDRWLNFYGGPESAAFPHRNLQDVLSTNVPRGFFTKKIVFVGQNLPSDNIGRFKDTFATPFSRFDAAPMPGVDIHATALLNLLRNDWLRQVPWEWQWFGAVIWATISVGAFFVVSRKPKIVLILVATLGATLLCAISLYVQWHFHWWWLWVGPVFGQTTTALVLVWRAPRQDPYIAFISYRTEEDGETALLVAEKLSDRGYKTFLDVRGLHAGKFDEQLLHEIEASLFFIPILSPNSLARCVQEDDWVLRELRHALSRKKRIIPVFKNGFSFNAADSVPKLPEIAELRNYQGLVYSHGDFEGFMRRLTELLKGQ